MSQHGAHFTWGAGPDTVCIAGNFNNWSASGDALRKQADGTFAGEVRMPWGEKQAFKYVVDGEWKVREDEAKEWDAAGNMNNVYTAPPPPVTGGSTAKPVPMPVPVSAAAAASVHPSSTSDTATPKSASPTTQPSSLLASTAPGAASSGATAPSISTASGGEGTHIDPAIASAPIAATAAVPLEKAPVVADPTPVQIEKVAAHANIGEAPVEDHDKGFAERAVEYGAGAYATLGSVVGGAVAAVERATGVDIVHTQHLMSVKDAQAQGIDFKTLPQRDAKTDAVSSNYQKPSADAVADLEEKTEQLRLDTQASGASVSRGASSDPYAGRPAPLEGANASEQTHDIPAQSETTDNHRHVPRPILSTVSDKDPKKDRTLNGSAAQDTAGTKPISTDPSVDPKVAKREAEAHPGTTGSTSASAAGVTSAPLGLPAGETPAAPDAKNANSHVGLGIDAAAQQPSTPAAAGLTGAVGTTGTRASKTSTPAGTPVKGASGHRKEDTSGSDVRKRKSSFFGKIKHALSPKAKEKK